MNKNASIGGDIAYFFPSKYTTEASGGNQARTVTFTLIALNAVIRFHPVHFNLARATHLIPYLLTGLNVASDGIEVSVPDFTDRGSQLELSINLGAGIATTTPIGVFFIEAKFVSGGFGYVAITGEFYQEVRAIGYRYLWRN